MCAHTSFRIGGPAEYYILPADREQLLRVLSFAADAGIRTLVSGNLSNVVFDDCGFSGAVIDTRALDAIRVDGCTIHCEAGATLASVCRVAAEHSLDGLAFACGIPGTVGGGVFMNAGAYGGQLSDVVSLVYAYDTEQKICRTFDSSACKFDYRSSIFMHAPLVILSCDLSLRAGNQQRIRYCMQSNLSRRREKQPIDRPSAGSVFKRPDGAFVGSMIEALGLKGMRIGGVAVSEKHAGFIVNLGGGTCRDLQALIELIRQKVLDAYGISLECEIRIVR